MPYIAWAPNYRLPLPEGHRFPMEKYELIPEQLLYEGSITEADLHRPQPLGAGPVLRVHCPQYWHKLNQLQLSRQEGRRIGFPVTRELFVRELTIAQGTINGCQQALQHGVALNVAGGTHHAYAEHGEGFCVLNDQAIAAQYLLDTGLARQILVVDLDVHQGNGTAALFAQEPRVYTFSMHGASNYPHRKETSDLDLPLPNLTTDAEYLRLLHQHLPRLLDRVQPDFVFYLSGVDVLASDKLGKLALSLEGCRRRDRYVLELCARSELPVMVCMGGGYSPRLADIVEAHCNTFRLAGELWG